MVRLTETGLEATEARARLADSDVARRLFSLDESDQALLVELLERVLANRPEPEVAAQTDTSEDSDPAGSPELEPVR
jgi:hypothetical protein